jgi:hypothetical protein
MHAEDRYHARYARGQQHQLTEGTFADPQRPSASLQYSGI